MGEAENLRKNTQLSEAELARKLRLPRLDKKFYNLFGQKNIEKLVSLLENGTLVELDSLSLTGDVEQGVVLDLVRTLPDVLELQTEIKSLAREVMEYVFKKRDRINQWLSLEATEVKSESRVRYLYKSGTKVKDTPCGFINVIGELSKCVRLNMAEDSLQGYFAFMFYNSLISEFFYALYNEFMHNDEILQQKGYDPDSVEILVAIVMDGIEHSSQYFFNELYQYVTLNFMRLENGDFCKMTECFASVKSEDFDFRTTWDLIMDELAYKYVSHSHQKCETGRVDLYFEELGEGLYSRLTDYIAFGICGTMDDYTPMFRDSGDGWMAGSASENGFNFSVHRDDGELYFGRSSIRMDRIFDQRVYLGLKKIVYETILLNLESKEAREDSLTASLNARASVRAGVSEVLREEEYGTDGIEQSYKYVPFSHSRSAEAPEVVDTSSLEVRTKQGRVSVSSYRKYSRVQAFIEGICGRPVRSNKHIIYKTPNGTTIVFPRSAKRGGVDVSHGLVLQILEALDISLEEYVVLY